jgi:DHA2 family methylenomycin A resistance protein-like MFS transporter
MIRPRCPATAPGSHTRRLAGHLDGMRATAAAAERAPTRSGVVLAVVCAGMFLVLLDVTIVNVALPSIGAGLRADTAGLQWVVDGYAVAIASLLLAGGTVGDRFGHRRMVLAGLVLFGLASAGCGLAPGVGWLVAARAVQGAGAALLLPGSIAVVVDTYPDRSEQARALGVWAAVSSLALPAGPLLGGALVTVAGWRSIFLLNVPVVLAAVLAVLRVVPTRPGHPDRPLDLPGMAAAVLGLGALVYAVIAVGRHGPAPGVLAAGGAAAVAVAAFLRRERTAPAPMLPLGLLRSRAFRGSNLVALIMNLVTNGIIFTSTLYLQGVRHHSPLAAGFLLLPLFLPLAVLSPVTGRLTARYGPRPPILAGSLLAGAGTAGLLLVGTAGPATRLLPAFLGLGLGNSLVTAAVVAAAVRAVPADRSGLASGVNTAARQTGTALGVAVFGAIAGSPQSPARFVAGLHHLAAVGALLWLAAAALTAVWIPGGAANGASRPDR